MAEGIYRFSEMARRGALAWKSSQSAELRLWSGNHLLEKFPGRRIRRRTCDQGFVGIEERSVEGLVLKEATEAGANNVAR